MTRCCLASRGIVATISNGIAPTGTARPVPAVSAIAGRRENSVATLPNNRARHHALNCPASANAAGEIRFGARVVHAAIETTGQCFHFLEAVIRRVSRPPK
jgi:hypothetical protein